MFKTLITLITSKARLYIEYAVLVAVIVLGCTALTFYWKTQVLQANTAKLQSDVTTLQTTVKQASADNAAQEKAINDLVTQRAQDAFAMQALSAKFDAFAASDAATRSKLNDLVKNNAQVRDHRNVPLPVDLQRLLNSPDTAAPDTNPSGKANPAGGTSAGMSAALSAAVGYEWRRGRRLVSVAIGCALLCGPHGCGDKLVQA